MILFNYYMWGYNFICIHNKLLCDIITLLALNYCNNNITKLLIKLFGINNRYMLSESISHNNIEMVKFIMKNDNIYNNYSNCLFISMRLNNKKISKLLLSNFNIEIDKYMENDKKLKDLYKYNNECFILTL